MIPRAHNIFRWKKAIVKDILLKHCYNLTQCRQTNSCSVSTQYKYTRPLASKLSTAMYPIKYGYERTCWSQVLQQRENVVVLHRVPLVCTWMDDELMVLMDAVVHGELVVNCAALMQYAMSSRATFEATSSRFSDICPWSRPGTSLEVCLRGDCSVWAHTDCLNKSGGIETLLFVGAFVILLPTKKLFACWKFVEGYNVQNGQLLALLSNFFGGWIEKNTNLDDNLYWRFYTRSRL